jgi:hypothetical protein
MPSWVKCTTTEGIAMQVNLDQVAMIRAYRSGRGFSGSEIVFATGTPSLEKRHYCFNEESDCDQAHANPPPDCLMTSHRVAVPHDLPRVHESSLPHFLFRLGYQPVDLEAIQTRLDPFARPRPFLLCHVGAGIPQPHAVGHGIVTFCLFELRSAWQQAQCRQGRRCRDRLRR